MIRKAKSKIRWWVPKGFDHTGTRDFSSTSGALNMPANSDVAGRSPK
jgi:hypothetical protein